WPARIPELIDPAEPGEQVVRVEHCALSNFPQTLAAVRKQIGICSDKDAEIPIPAVHSTNRARPLVFPSIAVPVACDDWNRQKLHQVRSNRQGPGTWPAATMRRCKGLVQVEVHDVKAHVTRPHLRQDGVEIRAVIVKLATNTMDQFCHTI